MKKWQKRLFLTGSISAMLGLGFLGLGYLNGGLDDIKTYSGDFVQQTETYDQVTDVDLTLFTRRMKIEESSDDKVHLSYYDNKNYLDQLNVRNNQGKLTLSEESNQSRVTGFLTAVGYFLNDKQSEKQTVVLSIPKGKRLTSLVGDVVLSEIQINNQVIDQVDLVGSVNVQSSQIFGGRITSGETESMQLSFQNSQLNNLRLDLVESTVLFTNTNLAQSNIILSGGDLTANNLTLDKVTLTGSSTEIDISGLSLKEDVKLTNEDNSINLQLASDSRNKLGLDLSVMGGTLKVAPDLMKGANTQQGEDDFQQVTKTLDDQTALLTLNVTEGDVTLE
ncbi:DUF4097 family beta strand repeat-containing protein [Streptococcus sp. sy018]|uniref:DUF4097 family beta strand repeat-containing protein n=1 Tax=Streptococcus sp. sy018 TaxID=2600147 RepID=UPI0011B6AD2D|nr:DUF4097 family beta strand repeat-containing protein [Streptococcus sp. sy018]TWS94574.1 DUF4097 domain-containing protein [Streptococcus sp. sy018]